jgi:16S rRNA (uracil1498-N3)-methyltransferase
VAQLYRLVLTPDQFQADRVDLSPDQLHYLQRVLRLRSPAQFIALNGQGQSWLAQLGDDSARLIAAIAESTELPVPITLAIALPKGSGFDAVVRQVTELGVSCIVPVLSDRTLLQPSASKLQRWRKIAQEAAEQSERQQVPTLVEPIAWSDYLHASNEPGQKLLCWARGQAPSLLATLNALPRQSSVIAIGPEGGWSPAEVEAAITAGYQPVSLGPRILRAVTAPIAVMAIVAAWLELDWNSRDCR